MKQEAGNALLITMVVIAVVGTVGFGVSRIAISSLRNQNRLEDSANAYQAAMAGVEDGLLRWRFNKDTEVPAPGSGPGCESSPHEKSEFYTRVNLSTGDVVRCVDPTKADSPGSNEIVYDLKIHYKLKGGTEEVVDERKVSGLTIPALGQDQVIEYDVSQVPSLGSNIINIGWIFQNASIFDARQRVEIFALDANGAIIEESKRFYQSTEPRVLPLRYGGTLGYNVYGGVKIRIRPFGEDLKQYKVVPTNTNVSVDSRINVIEVTGYFSNSKRKLKLSLDRESGALLPLYDYVLFSGGSGIEPAP